MIEVWKRGSYVYVCIIDLLRFALCWPKGWQPLVTRLFCLSKNPRQFENVLCFVFTTDFNDYLQDYLKLSNVWLTYTLGLAIYLLTWENSDDTSLAFPSKWLLRNKPTNSILMTCHYPDLGSPPDWSCREGNLLQPIRNITQIWVVTRHQHGICTLVSQTSFRGEGQWRVIAVFRRH